MRDRLSEAIALRKLGSKQALSVPFLYSARLIARSWGVPPWVVTGEDPDPDTVARWLVRERIFLNMEG